MLVKAKPATALNNTTATQRESTHLINPKQHSDRHYYLYNWTSKLAKRSLTQPERFFWIICSQIPRFVGYFQRIRDVNLTTNLTQARELICRFYHIFQGYSYKNLHFPHIKHCPNSFAIKRRRKSVDRSPKCFLWTSKQLFAIHFFLATCTVCPLAIPEFFAQTPVSDYWQIIHWSFFTIFKQTIWSILGYHTTLTSHEIPIIKRVSTSHIIMSVLNSINVTAV